MNANLELLSREMGENQWLSNLQYENERMSGLIAQLLDLARTENVAPPMEPVDFSRLTLGETLPLNLLLSKTGCSSKQRLRTVSVWTAAICSSNSSSPILTDNAIRHSEHG